MTSESTRKVIDQLNAANEEAKAQLMVLDCHKGSLNDSNNLKTIRIRDQEKEIYQLKGIIADREKKYEFNMILMIFSLIFGFSAIGYAVLV